MKNLLDYEEFLNEGTKFTDQMDADTRRVYYEIYKKIGTEKGDIKDYKELEAELSKHDGVKDLIPRMQRLLKQALQWVITYTWEMER